MSEISQDLQKIDLLLVEILKNLSEKNIDKRRLGVKNLQNICNQYIEKKQMEEFQYILKYLKKQINNEKQQMIRKGAFDGISALTQILETTEEQVIIQFQFQREQIEDLLSFISSHYVDSDVEIRKACYSTIYNLIKYNTKMILTYVSQIFTILVTYLLQIQALQDQETNCKQVAKEINVLLLQTITESDQENTNFNLDEFMPIFCEKLKVIQQLQNHQTHIKFILIQWMKTLDSIPMSKFFSHFPSFCEYLFFMLKDPDPDIRNSAECCLNEFLKDLLEGKKVIQMNMKVVDTCVKLFQSQNQYSSDYQAIYCAQQWCHSFFQICLDQLKCEKPIISQSQIMLKISLIFEFTINYSVHENQKIREQAQQTNQIILKLIDRSNTSELLELDQILQFLEKIINNENQQNIEKIQLLVIALQWFLVFLQKFPEKVVPFISKNIHEFFEILKHHEESVMQYIIDIMIIIQNFQKSYKFIFSEILKLLFQNQNFLNQKSYLIIKLFCQKETPQIILPALSEYLPNFKENQNFMFTIVKIVDSYLMRDDDCKHFRLILQDLNKNQTEENINLFIQLYNVWIYNPVATISLCLLCQQYQLAYRIITSFTDVDLKNENLVQLGKLVTLLESSAFVQLRLQLLEFQKFPYLIKALNGILMLLPQSKAFIALDNRLHSIQKIVSIQIQVDASQNNELVFNKSGISHLAKLKLPIENLISQYIQIHH